MKDLAMMKAMVELMENALARAEERYEMYYRFGDGEKASFYQGRKSMLNELLMAAQTKISECRDDDAKVEKLIASMETFKSESQARRVDAHRKDLYDTELINTGKVEAMEAALYMVDSLGLRKKGE